MVGKSLLQISLECIKYWAEMFPVDPLNENLESAFKETYRNLMNEKVKFPEKAHYFKIYIKEKKKQAQNGQLDKRFSKRLSKRVSIYENSKDKDKLHEFIKSPALDGLQISKDQANTDKIFMIISS